MGPRRSTPDALDAAIDEAAAADWREKPLAERVAILHRAGDILQNRRGDLLEVMGSECGKVIEQGDAEVSEAIDFAHFSRRAPSACRSGVGRRSSRRG